jgi:hypothetical protein
MGDLIQMLLGVLGSGAGAAGASGATQGAGGLMGLLGSGGMGNASSSMSGPVAGAVLPQSQVNQALSGSTSTTNPLMSSNIGVGAPPPNMGSGNGGKEKKWEKWATPQDTSAGLVAGSPQDPMYGQMMQQVMQSGQQQPQKQTMTPLSMPGAIQPVNNPNDDIMSLFKRLLGDM